MIVIESRRQNAEKKSKTQKTAGNRQFFVSIQLLKRCFLSRFS